LNRKTESNVKLMAEIIDEEDDEDEGVKCNDKNTVKMNMKHQEVDIKV